MWGDADGVFDGTDAVTDFPACSLGGGCPEGPCGVRVGMRLQAMACANHGLCEVGCGDNFRADSEESGNGVMVFEYREHFWRVDRVGSVVDGDPDFALVGFEV